MLPKNKPLAELQAIKGLRETYKDTLRCEIKEEGYYFTEINSKNGFYFWIKSIEYHSNSRENYFYKVTISEFPESIYSNKVRDYSYTTARADLLLTTNSYLGNWYETVKEYNSFDYNFLTQEISNPKISYQLTTDTLKHLGITNFKGISYLEINFSKQITILLGRNATGKTSILQALALALLPDDNTDKDREFEKLIKIGNEYSVLKHAFVNESETQETIIGNNRKKRTTTSHTVINVLAYSANLFYNKGEKNKYQEFVKSMIFGNAPHYFTRSLFRNFDDNLLDILDVLNNLYYEERREKDENLVANYKAIREIISLTINELLPIDLIKIALVENRSYYFVSQSGDNLDTDQLSEGYRANVILLGDILCRLMAMRGNLQGESLPIAEVFEKIPGVVLIDEFDRHLHPSWQQNFVDNLLIALPSIQFVLTTHNPMAILNRKADEVLKLVFDEKGNLSTKTEEATENLDVSMVLLEYFELDSLVSKKLQEKIETYQQARIDGDKETAELLKKELNNLLVGFSIHDKAYWEYLKFLQSKGVDLQDVKLGKFDIQKILTK